MSRFARSAQVLSILLCLGLLSSCAIKPLAPRPSSTPVQTQTPTSLSSETPNAQPPTPGESASSGASPQPFHTPATRKPLPPSTDRATPTSPPPNRLTVSPSQRPIATEVSEQQEEQTITVTLDIDGDTHRINITENASAYDLLMKAQREGRVTFSGKQFLGLGFFVEEINGRRQIQGEMYWILYVNGTKSSVGVSSYFLRPSDVIHFHYEAAE